MGFQQVPQSDWREWFDRMTDQLRGRQVEVEVIGLDLGDQVEAEWLTLNGITYDPGTDVLYLLTDPGDGSGPAELAIDKPREIYIELGAEGVSQIVFIDSEGRKQLARLRAPLELPAGLTQQPPPEA